MKISKSLALPALFGAVLMVGLAGCASRGPMEKTGEAIDEAVDDIGDGIEDAFDD